MHPHEAAAQPHSCGRARPVYASVAHRARLSPPPEEDREEGRMRGQGPHATRRTRQAKARKSEGESTTHGRRGGVCANPMARGDGERVEAEAGWSAGLMNAHAKTHTDGGAGRARGADIVGRRSRRWRWYSAYNSSWLDAAPDARGHAWAHTRGGMQQLNNRSAAATGTETRGRAEAPVGGGCGMPASARIYPGGVEGEVMIVRCGGGVGVGYPDVQGA
ncbi:hypothetical protein B0H17DRAFT_1127246 [Mycena rosella]|uniref:Uncharacterized protein n=1 Tax=Mycena rosella TaxID=1033263 RepID=A0AAD7E2M5_MYCRO|nr:hypothetical protein B0H17DRAFT_1127246 [Mycena rosella]